MDINVRSAQLVVATVKLSPKLFKQIQSFTYDEYMQTIREYREAQSMMKHPECTAELKEKLLKVENPHFAWISGEATGDEWSVWLLLYLGDGLWAKYKTSKDHVTRQNVPQVYLV